MTLILKPVINYYYFIWFFFKIISIYMRLLLKLDQLEGVHSCVRIYYLLTV